MEKTLLLVLILSGLSVLSTKFVREYHYVQKLKTWTEAQTYCRERFHDLATVTNHEENQRLLRVLKGNGKSAWIGLYDGLRVWKWYLGNVKLNNDLFSNWAKNQPDNDHRKNCCVMTKEGFWYNTECDRSRPSVCYYEQGPSKYILVQTKKTQHKARKFCRANYTQLASVRSQSEKENISSLLSENTWIGLYRRMWESWSDQTTRTFGYWNKGQPDSTAGNMTACGAVSIATGKWFDVHCKTKRHFICQTGSEHKTALKLKFQSKADLSDPALQQQILEQLHAKLEKHGIPDFKLRWRETDGQTFHKEQKEKKDKG
ncbi:C-type mannose receptor 2-like [Centropristis striata]|uniref:C-type mannose receptor 2-like n=1 Tax=Centropristis striata TaxID=184440 RepID=UPI0027DF2A10|nr:C-type mannose receptor 2-like [Centropristis striata]